MVHKFDENQVINEFVIRRCFEDSKRIGQYFGAAFNFTVVFSHFSMHLSEIIGRFVIITSNDGLRVKSLTLKIIIIVRTYGAVVIAIFPLCDSWRVKRVGNSKPFSKKNFKPNRAVLLRFSRQSRFIASAFDFANNGRVAGRVYIRGTVSSPTNRK